MQTNTPALNKRARVYLLVAAGVLLAGALLWGTLLNNRSFGGRICRMLANYDYQLHPDDLYVTAAEPQTSIRALFGDMDLSGPLEASRAVGLPSDIERIGDITMLLAQAENGDTITLFLLGEDVELGFVQAAGGDVYPLGGSRE